MRRRLFLLACAGGLLRADTRDEIVELFGSMAAALSAGDALGFLKACDPEMPGYAALEGNVTALADAMEVTSSIEILRDEGGEQQRSVELDWLLQFRPKEASGELVRRRELVKCRLQRRKKKWLVVSLEPQGFFAPPKPQ